MNSPSEKFYETQVIGCGPAGLGVAVAADRRGLIEKLLRRGILFVDKNPEANIGSGDFRNLCIRSNSAASDYLESIRPDGVFSDVLKLPAAGKIASFGKEIVPLTLIAELLEDIGRKLREAMEGYPESDLLAATQIEGVIHNPCSPQRRFESFTTGNKSFVSQNVVLATGGQEMAIDLGEHSQKLILSRNVLHDDDVITQIRQRLAKHFCERVAIIGGSHSAFSVAWRLHEEVIARDFPLGCIDVIHRHPVRLFYDSVEEALRDGYSFDPIHDVCPVTHRVNRFSGIRGDAKDLYRAIVNGKEEHVRLVQCNKQNKGEVEETLEHVAVIVQAFGYSANSVPIFGPNDLGIGPRLKDNDQLDVTKECRIYDYQRRLIDGTYAIGLGHGITPDPAVGGEPSFRGVLDAVNLYHGKVGEIILDQILS